jgi:hypothetical protein
MKVLNFFIALCLCTSLVASTMSSEPAHRATEEKVEGYDLEKLRSLPDETIITWALCPGYELGKDEIIQLAKNETLTFDGPWTSVKISLTKEEKKEDEKHIAFLWANDIEGEELTKERSKDNQTEMGYFRNGEKLLLEKGKWNGHAFEYTYRWPGDLEKDKHIKVTVDITIKDPSTEIGEFLHNFLNRIKGAHKPGKHHKTSSSGPTSPTGSTTSSTPTSPVFAAQQPATIVPPQIVYRESPPIVVSPAPYYGYPYGSPPVVGGLWLGGGWGHPHYHRRW